VTCAVFVLPPPLDYRLGNCDENNEDVVNSIPWPISVKHGSQVNKVCSKGATWPACNHEVISCQLVWRSDQGRQLWSPVVFDHRPLTASGSASAIVFAREGARIVVSGRRDPTKGKELVAELQGARSRGHFCRLMSAMMRRPQPCGIQTVKRFGPWISQSQCWLKARAVSSRNRRGELRGNVR